MSSSSYCLLHLCFLLIISSITCLAQTTTSHPKTLFLAVKKDPSTLQYITEIHQRTPLVPLKLAIHLGGESLWVDCEQDYESSTYKPARCNSRQCNLARSTACGSCHTGTGARPGCNSNSCYNVVENPIIDTIYTGGEIAGDVLSIVSVNGTFPGPVATMSSFIFSCSPSYLTRSLGKDVKGMIGFGQQSPVSLATQFASAFRFSRKFAICLSSTKELDVNGIIYIGQSPYLFSPGYDASRDLIYTPIITYSPSIFINRPSSEYYIQVSSIKINGKTLPLNRTLLSLDKSGNGGTRISTTVPYTVLETSICNAVTKAFVKEMPKEVRSVPAVQPFTTCFNSRDIGMSRLGYNAPEINFVLHKQNVHWKITGANSFVEVSGDVICLAFVEERRQESGQSIIIGGFQMQDNLIEFDLSKKRIGFSNSLFSRQTMCSNQGFA